MAPPPIAASLLISAPPPLVYGIITDYRHGHPQILPMPPFVSLAVEEGGVGAGTRFLAQIKMLGSTQSFRGVVSEPQPGHTLVETTDSGIVTSFIVEPRDDGRQSYVTISSELARSGPLGALARWIYGRMLRPVYARELAQLAGVAARAS